MRLAGLVRKEFLQIVRDPSSIAIAFVMPVFLLLLFGYGVSLDADRVPVAWWPRPSPDTPISSPAFKAALLRPRVMPLTGRSRAGAAAMGEVNAIVRLRADFAERLRRPDGAPDSGHRQRRRRQYRATCPRATSKAPGATGWPPRGWPGRNWPLPVDLEQRIWFNSECAAATTWCPGWWPSS
jgi:ABC-2 type transport system permease protein